MEPLVMRKIAVFDFDDTLVHGDSLWPFLLKLAGTVRVVWAMGWALATTKTPEAESGFDRRGMVKANFLRALLAGRSLASLQESLAALQSWSQWRQDIVAKLHEHKAAGCHIVIASGGLDIYLPTLLQGLPYDTLICTRMVVEDGVLTGAMAGGNCVRAEKARRIADYLAAHGPFMESWGYGNAPHDEPMLALLQHKTII
jgi:phosphatidylglycerophosphatase C